MTQPASIFYSSSGSRELLPGDGEFSCGLLETMHAARGSIPLLSLHLARFTRCAGADSFLHSQVKTAAEKIALQTKNWLYGARIRFRYGNWRGAPCWDFSAVPLEVSSPWDLGVNLICCETRLEPEASVSLFTFSSNTETRSGCAPVAAAGCKLLQRTLYERAAAELPRVSAAEPLPEGLLLDRHGHVIEALRCNLLVRDGGCWLTPDLSECGVRGVMLEWLASHAKISEHPLTCEDLLLADELAVCNSVRGVVPVVGLQGLDGKAALRISTGPATRALQQLVGENLW
ncbi:aminotransferase class IV [Microbulbifer pacificus]|uniref:aminotransferase class IV n=1 Tax=Microbulbifer pacificus TaxID=407164 RepID=UPI00227913EE|nr:aminotransferase class IV [Microbulbifer pacificus]